MALPDSTAFASVARGAVAGLQRRPAGRYLGLRTLSLRPAM